MDTSSQDSNLNPSLDTQLVPKWLPPSKTSVEGHKRHRKTRVEVAFLNNSIPKPLNPNHLKLTRVLGDYLLFADGNEAQSFFQQAAPFHVTKKISSFEVDDVRSRFNVFNQPFSNMDMPSTVSELMKSGSKKIQDTVKALLDLEALAPQIPDFVSKMQYYPVNGSWMEMFRRGEEPFNSMVGTKTVGMFVWEILYNDSRWDLRLAASTLPFASVRAFGFSVSELTEGILHDKIPIFLPKTCNHHSHVRHMFQFLKEILQSPTDICGTEKLFSFRVRDGTTMNVRGQEEWRMARVGDKAFLMVKRHGDKVFNVDPIPPRAPDCDECNEHQIVTKKKFYETKGAI